LIAGILIGYSMFTRPSEQEKAEMQRVRDSIAIAEQFRMQEAQKQQAEEIKTMPSEAGSEVSTVVQEKVNTENFRDVYGAFAEAAQGSEEYITLENDRLKIRIAKLGGRPYSVHLKEYMTHDTLPLILFDGDSTVFGMQFFAQNRSINTNELFFTPDTKELHLDASSSSVSLSMKLPAGEGRFIEYVYTMEPESYMVGFDLRFVNMGDLLSQNNNFIDLNWNIYVPQQEMGRMNELNYTTIYMKHYQDEVEKLAMRSKKEVLEKDVPTKIRWIAFKQQFFSSVFIADENFSNATVRSTTLEEDPTYLYTFESQIGIPLSQGAEQTSVCKFYFGPNHYNTLKSFDLELQDLVGLGGLMSRVINKWVIIPVFTFLNRFIDNYGLIILILTIMIKLVLFPLTYRSYMSMAKMRGGRPCLQT